MNQGFARPWAMSLAAAQYQLQMHSMGGGMQAMAAVGPFVKSEFGVPAAAWAAANEYGMGGVPGGLSAAMQRMSGYGNVGAFSGLGGFGDYGTYGAYGAAGNAAARGPGRARAPPNGMPNAATSQGDRIKKAREAYENTVGSIKGARTVKFDGGQATFRNKQVAGGKHDAMGADFKFDGGREAYATFRNKHVAGKHDDAFGPDHLSRRTWTMVEVEALKRGVEVHGRGNWQKILDDPATALLLQSRTNINLKDKWRNLSPADHTNKRKRDVWTVEEEIALMESIMSDGIGNWDRMARTNPGLTRRSAVSIKDKCRTKGFRQRLEMWTAKNGQNGANLVFASPRSNLVFACGRTTVPPVAPLSTLSAAAPRSLYERQPRGTRPGGDRGDQAPGMILLEPDDSHDAECDEDGCRCEKVSTTRAVKGKRRRKQAGGGMTTGSISTFNVSSNASSVKASELLRCNNVGGLCPEMPPTKRKEAGHARGAGGAHVQVAQASGEMI